MARQLQELVAVVDDYLATHLAGACDQPLLEKSMAYSLLAGGKRLRPTLTIAVAELLGKTIDDDLVRAACALELIHTYSLIHDDLPAMDNDDLRRGKPTNHRVYGPGVATLAGDGLLTLAFEWVSDNQLKAPVRLRLVQELAKAAGPAGMVAGQATDMSATGQELSLAQLKKLHRQKTGALLRYAVLAGGLIAEQETAVLDCLTTFGEAYGLAFQIYDDILDVTATTAEMGKATHKDQAKQKNTYPGLLGLAGAKGELEAALTTARGAAAELGRLTGKETVILDDFLAYYRISGSNMEKERVDILLVKQGLFDSREQAKRAVMAGEILGLNNERLDKPGQKIPVTTTLHMKGKKMPYVSRGGLKLAKALQVFKISVENKVVLDIGSSTGGFTDVMLQNGAKRSYALDVGTNQLVWQLRDDPRVVVMEQTNFRYSKKEDFTAGQPEFASIDVSFISLSMILPPLAQILTPGGEVVALIKPQFEAGKEHVGKHGIIRERKVHEEVLTRVLSFMAADGFDVLGLDYSPIKGGQGNVEFLAHLKLATGPAQIAPEIDINHVIDAAYAELNS